MRRMVVTSHRVLDRNSVCGKKNGVLYGIKAFGIKNLNSNVSCKIMPKVVRIVQGGKGRRYGRRLLSNLKAGVPNAGY